MPNLKLCMGAIFEVFIFYTFKFHFVISMTQNLSFTLDVKIYIRVIPNLTKHLILWQIRQAVVLYNEHSDVL